MDDDQTNDSGGGGGGSLIPWLLILGGLFLVARRWGAACAALGALAFVIFDAGFFIWLWASPRDADGGAVAFALAVFLGIFPLWGAIHCGRAYRRRAVARAAWEAEAHREWWFDRPIPEPPAWMRREHDEWQQQQPEQQRQPQPEQQPEPQRQPESARWQQPEPEPWQPPPEPGEWHPQPPPDPWQDTLPAWPQRQPEQQHRLAGGFRSRPFA